MIRQSILAASVLLNVALAGYLVVMQVTPPSSPSVVLPESLATSHRISPTATPSVTAPATSVDASSNPAAALPPPIVQTKSNFPASVPPMTAVAQLPAPAPTSNAPALAEIARTDAPSYPSSTVPSANETSSGRAVQSNAPGNFIHFRGMQVAVAENLSSQGAVQPSLAVDVSPASNVSASGDSVQTATSNISSAAPASEGSPVAVSPPNFSTPGVNTPTSSPAPGKNSSYRPDPSVFSAEDDLFRTRWGAAAYAAAQKEAAIEASNKAAQ